MVDLPEPDRPMITKISPLRTWKLASLTPTVTPSFLNTSSLVAPAYSMSKAGLGSSEKIL